MNRNSKRLSVCWAWTLVGCLGCADEPGSPNNAVPTVVPKKTFPTARKTEPINDVCPRSGKPVSADSLTKYRGHTVGFCNTHCRDDFAANVADRPDDRTAFDKLIDASGPSR